MTIKSKRFVALNAAILALLAQQSSAQVVPSKTTIGKDSVVVQAESFHNGKLLAGSPVTLVVPIRGTVPR